MTAKGVEGDIVYSLIGRVCEPQNVILCDGAGTNEKPKETVKAVAQKLLAKIKKDKHRDVFRLKGYNLLFIVEQKIAYTAVVTEKFKPRLAFYFLEDIRKLFEAKYLSDASSATKPYACASFATTLEQRMEYFNNEIDSDVLERILGKIAQAQANVEDATKTVIANTEQLESVLEKSEALKDDSMQYKEKATALKWEMFYRNMKYWIALGVLVVVIIVVIIIYFCVIK